MRIEAGADGSALGNPGPTGWAWYIDEDRWRAGGFAHGTNNIGELVAVLDLLQQTAVENEKLHIICDSTYVINTITKWMAGWKRKGWRKGDGKPVQNLEIIQALDEAMTGRDVTFEWVKGHTGHPLNEAADKLANAAAQAFKEGDPADEGPGFSDGSAPVVPAIPDEDQIVAGERVLVAGSGAAGRDALDRLLHPEWRAIGRTGRIWSREEILQGAAGSPSVVELEVLELHRISADLIALITRRSADDRSIWSSWWQRAATGEWQARFHQGTPER